MLSQTTMFKPQSNWRALLQSRTFPDDIWQRVSSDSFDIESNVSTAVLELSIDTQMLQWPLGGDD